MPSTAAIRPLRHAVLLASALLLGACGDDAQGPTLTSSVFPSSCLGPLFRNEAFFPNAEVEPSIAVDPTNPAHLITVWQQDRYSGGGSAGLLTGVSFDAGNTWATASAPFSFCTGGNVSNGGNYQRASDPWITIAPDGTAHQIALTFDVSNGGGHRGILASRSTDGKTWSAAQTLQGDTDFFFTVDKGSITADPQNASLVYAVWDRLTNQDVFNSPQAHGPAWFARTTDGGASWEPARNIYDPGADAQTIGNIVAALPDGTLLNAMLVLTGVSQPAANGQIAVLRSTDKGLTWPAPPIAVSAVDSLPVVDPKTGLPVRTGGSLPSIAVDASTSKVYVVWEDSALNGGARNGIALSASADSGLHWSAPIQVNRVPQVTAFTPAVSAGGGKIAVTYYDFRADVPSDSRLLASSWLVISADGGTTWQETALAGPFDLHTAPFAQGYFLGDYEGLSWDGTAFVSFFSAANSGNLADRTSLLFRRVLPP